MTSLLSTAVSFCSQPLLFVVLLACISATTCKEIVVINLEEAPAASATPATLQSLVPKLNRFTFYGNVITTSDEDHVSHWIVNFCPDWWEPCQNLVHPFAERAAEWESMLNTQILNMEVRFATVDCATDKLLCNEQGVDGYPSVHRYHKGKRVASWSGNRKDDTERLAKWLQGQLGRVAEIKAVQSPPSSFRSRLEKYLMPGDRTIDLLLVIGVLALNFWAVINNPQLWHKQASDTLREPAVETLSSSALPLKDRLPAETMGPKASTVARFLPEGWASKQESMEL